MDKKNTMLLTVIAVATLFVAVVGATFAYFSISGINNTKPNVLQASMGTLGTVTLKSPNTSFKINLSGNEMRQNLGGIASYYSVPINSTENFLTSPDNAYQKILLASVKDEDVNHEYKCNGSVKITLSANNVSTLSSLLPNDGEIVFGGAMDGVSKKLTEIKTGNNYELLLDNIEFSGLKNGADKDISAYLKINNTDVPQNYLQGENLVVTIIVPTFSCDLINK